MYDLTIGIIGKISVGKSSIARALHEKTGIPYTSFGSYLVAYSKLNNLPIDRTSLQNLGNKFIKENSQTFLSNVLKNVTTKSNIVILEGIRHVDILESIKKINKKVLFIFIDASPAIRYERYLNRQPENIVPVGFDEFLQKDNHVVESEIDLLKPQCDLIVDSEKLTVNEVLDFIYLFIKPHL